MTSEQAQQLDAYSLTESLTQTIRTDLNDRGKDFVGHTAKMFQELIKGIRHDEFIIKPARSFALREVQITNTNEVVTQIESIDAEMAAQMENIDKRLKELAKCNSTMKETTQIMKDLGKTWMMHNLQMKKT